MRLTERWREHLAENNMTYWQHFRFAAGHGCRCIRAACMLLLHAAAPCWFRRAGSNLVARMQRDFQQHRRQR